MAIEKSDREISWAVFPPRAPTRASGRSRPQNVLVRDCRLNCQVKTQHLSTCTGAHRGPPTGSWKEGGPTCALGSRRHEYFDRPGPRCETRCEYQLRLNLRVARRGTK